MFLYLHIFNEKCITTQELESVLNGLSIRIINLEAADLCSPSEKPNEEKPKYKHLFIHYTSTTVTYTSPRIHVVPVEKC